MSTIKKGTEVWFFVEWDDKATIAVRRYTVTSWGKKQGTAVQSVNGENVQHRLYPFDIERMIPVADLADPAEEALRRAREFKEKRIRHYVDCAHHYHLNGKTGDGYFAAIKTDCEHVLAAEPKVLFDN